MTSTKDEAIAARHAGIVTPPLFDLGAQDHVTRDQLCTVAEALGLAADSVSRIILDTQGITAEVLEDGQVALKFWGVIGP